MAQDVRRLAAIVSADVAGYSRLMGRDESGTLRRLNGHRSELLDPLIDEHGGRIVKTTGDGLLLEFPSVVAAVQCCISVQEGLAERNADVADDDAIRFRIGVHLGDVIVEGDDIFGDGVNVAARLEGLADPGGICLSRAARDQVRDRLDVTLSDMGEVEVKNIARPIRAFKIAFDGAPVSVPMQRHKRNQQPIYIAIAVVVAFVAGGVLWQKPWVPRVESASPDRMSQPLPNRPSVAVLPFDNIANDKAQERLIRGLAGDIIGALSRLTELFVIDQMSTETYAGKTVSVRQAAEDLGVQYIVLGDLERDGNRLRINVQLVDALTGETVWSERYQRTIRDLFAVRDDIARRIVQAVGIKIGSGDQTDLKGDDMSLEAWLLMKEASEFANEPSPKNLRRGREIMERVVKMEPDIAKAYVWLSVLTRLEVQLGSSKDPEADMQKAREAAQKAKELKPDDGGSYTALSNWYIMRGQHDEGVNAIRQAVKLEPGNAPIVGTGAMVYFYAGDYQEAIRHGQRALRMLPRSRLHWIMAQVGSAMQISGDLKGAEKIWREMLSTDPAAFWVGISKQQLAIIAGDRGDDMMGRQLVEEALKAAPYLTQAGMRQRSPMRDPNALDPWLNTLDRLGLPAK